MATFWLLLASALCGSHIVVNGLHGMGSPFGGFDPNSLPAETCGCGGFNAFNEQVSR